MTFRPFVAAIMVLSTIGAVANACGAVELLVGIRRLKEQDWIEHGAILSVGSNLVAWPFIALARENLGLVKHVMVGLTL